MKKLTLLALMLLVCALPCLAAPGTEFAIKKVALDYPTSPDFQGINPGNNIQWKPQQWAKFEVTFDAAPEFTDELTFNYYVLYSERPAPDRLFVGRVNHVNIVKGQGLHSVMYLSPKTIQRISPRSNKVFVPSTFPITQVTVTITKPGVAAPIAIGSFKPGAQGEWWSTIKQEEGFLVNKNETPFAPLYWDYYESIKTAAAR